MKIPFLSNAKNLPTNAGPATSLQASPALHLRTSAPFRDLANGIARLVWEHLENSGSVGRLDPHRFPDLTHRIFEVLPRFLEPYGTESEMYRCDPWSRITYGAPARPEQLPLCDGHEGRIFEENHKALEDLISALEACTLQFIERSDSAGACVEPQAILESIRLALQPPKRYLCSHLRCSNCPATRASH